MNKIISENGKVLYETNAEDEILLKYTDDLVDNRGNVKGSVKNKATINASIAVHVFKILASYHVPTFYKSQKSSKELLLKNVELLPVQVLVSQGTTEGSLSPELKFEALSDDNAKTIDADEVVASKLLTAQQLFDIRRYALKINVVLRNFFERRGLELTDFSVRFGLVNGKIAVCSDFTVDSCDLKDIESKTKFKKSYLLSHIDDASELYELVQSKIFS